MLSADSDDVDSSSDCDSSFQDSEFQNDYAGYIPPPGVATIVERVSPDISPSEFFEKFIKPRRPAIIGGLISDVEWRGTRWTDDYLRQKAGDVNVLVENRKNPAGDELLSYGTSAPKVEMRYGEFLSALSAGDTHYYMTTQDPERRPDQCDRDGLPLSVFTEPLQSLRGDFPVRPKILGNLFPHQISLWQGLSGRKQRSSTGLHHDFHDNLYVLIRGNKRFRLLPPSWWSCLRLSGTPSRVHRNGLIVYRTSCHVRADGAPLVAVARQRRDEAERSLEAAEEKLSSIQSVSKEDCKAELTAAVIECERKLEDALDELLRYEDVESDNDSLDEPPVKQAKIVETSSEQVHVGRDNLPDHFCRVVLPEDDVTDSQLMFSGISGASLDEVGCLVVQLKAGEMLYIPASWFHEVSSSDNDSNVNEAGHLALNYWNYPPDGDTFEQPYADNFWSQHWFQRMSSSHV